MKVCLINSFFEPFVMGGAEVYAQGLAEGLSKYHQVMFITTCPYSGWSSVTGRVEQKGSIKVIRFFPLNLYWVYYAQKQLWLRALWHAMQIWNPHTYWVIRGILKREKPDIVHSHTLRALSYSVVSAIDSLGIPHIHTLHDYELLSPWGNLLRRGKIMEKFGVLDLPYLVLMRHLTRNVKAVIGPSRFVLDWHLKYGFFRKARKYAIPNGLNLPHAHNSSKDYEILNILFVGALSQHKGVHTLLDAFTSLNESNVRLHVAGRGPLAQRVSHLASQDSRIEYHGHVPQGEPLWKLYSEANLLVLPSIWLEILGLVAIEAFSFGTPVIGSAIGGIPEVVEDGYNGLLFKPGDVDDLSRTLKRVLSDIELLKRLGENARKSVQKYKLDTHIESILKVYEEVLG